MIHRVIRLVTIVNRVSPAPLRAPLYTFNVPCIMKKPPTINRYSLPMAITFGSWVKALINSSPKKKTAAKAKRLNTAFTLIEKRSPVFTRSNFPAPMFCPVKAAKAPVAEAVVTEEPVAKKAAAPKKTATKKAAPKKDTESKKTK